MREGKVKRLREYLDTLNPGPVGADQQAGLKTLLEDCWYELDGSMEESTYKSKVPRLEKPEWQPPVLTFELERHGATVRGSSRGEAHTWAVNLEDMSAHIEKTRRRQIYPMQARLDVNQIARELSRAIVNGVQDPRLERAKNGKVRVLTGSLFPQSSMQTLEGRRKRLHAAMRALLTQHGWQLHGSWWSQSGD